MIDLRALRSPPRGKGKNEMKEMPSLFLCHASVDKPFVEKLANDLKGAGVNVWFDQWNIRVGESITWKIDEGIRENEYLSIVMSPESVNSEWVKTELGAAWNKQMATRKIVVLPVLYRDCAIPAILADRKYADFRSDYNRGFRELTAALGLVGEAILSADNWRDYRAQSDSGWQKFREKEFRQLVTRIVDRAKAYHWGFWVGASKNPFSFTVSAIDGPKKSRKEPCRRLNGERTEADKSENKKIRKTMLPMRHGLSDFCSFQNDKLLRALRISFTQRMFEAEKAGSVSSNRRKPLRDCLRNFCYAEFGTAAHPKTSLQPVQQ